jgi:hypothetical protein
LAEAFYQSVAGPFQLLIVGDPLCQPWVQFPTVSVKGLVANQTVRGSITITPSGTAGGGRPLRMIDVYLDGKLTARLTPEKPLTLDTTKIADGYHELRVVGVESGQIETQGRAILPFTVNNHDAKLEVKVAPAAVIDIATDLRISVRQPGATSVAIRQNSRVLASVQAEEGEVTIPAATLGRGPTTLQASSEGKAAVVSAPMHITVK